MIKPTVEEPVRERWTAVQAEVLQLRQSKKPKERAAAEQRLRDFLDWMRGLRVLDPACGSGNFLYVTMHLLKEIEYEAVRELVELTGGHEFRMQEIGPWNFLGIEVKPWAREIAELTLWIGFHQYWMRHHAVQPPEPVLQDTGTLELRDAVMAWDEIRHIPGRDVQDPTPRIAHPVTGEMVPDPAAKLSYMEYVGARPAAWPEADFIVGNPPYLGQARQREMFGSGYVDALRTLYTNVPDTADYVMYWWHRASEAVASGRTLRAGLITTNSITQPQNRVVVARAAERGVHVTWAIPDHPWVDGADGADVRVAMTVTAHSPSSAVRVEVDDLGAPVAEFRVARLNADLSAHADVPSASRIPLQANRGLCVPGFKLHGAGFILSAGEAEAMICLDARNADVVRPYRNGRDLAARPRGAWVIDFGMREEEEARTYAAPFDVVRDKVQPERAANRRAMYAKYWWRFGEPRRELRAALDGLPQYIATVETSKHRYFTFLDAGVAPDNKLVLIACADPYMLGVLSSSVHVAWALAAGARLGVGNDPVYVKSACFDAFPFPDPTPAQRERIGAVAQRIHEHRERALGVSTAVTITGIYNVMEKLRSGEALSMKERDVHQLAACGTLRDLHDDLDRLVAEAYGWSWPEPPALILERLVALHDQRVTEENAGRVRWLRPDYQVSRFGGDAEVAAESPTLELHVDQGTAATTPTSPAPRVPWPSDAVGQITVLRTMAAMTPLSADEAIRMLSGARRDIVARHLETLAILGEVREVGDGRFAVAAGQY